MFCLRLVGSHRQYGHGLMDNRPCEITIKLSATNYEQAETEAAELLRKWHFDTHTELQGIYQAEVFHREAGRALDVKGLAKQFFSEWYEEKYGEKV